MIDITQMALARLRKDESHEPRGGGWSLWWNCLAIFGWVGTVIGYLLGISIQDRVYRAQTWPALGGGWEMASRGPRGH